MGCYKSTVIDAPADEAWAALRKFHDLSWAANVVTSLEPEGDPETPGAQRVLNGAFHETLLSIDDDERVLEYSIDDGPEAVSKENVSGYVGRVAVFPVTDENKTFVLWTSRWESSGGGVAEFCNPIYQALLGDLKSHFES